MKTCAAWLAVAAAPAAAENFRRHRATSERSLGRESVSSLYPFYHSTEDIHAELQRLAGSCKVGFSLQTVGDPGERSIDVVTLKAQDATPINKNFLLFGEHSRELISAESGLHLVRSLCGETPELSQRAQEVLKDSEFQIVVNGNPGSRRKVEGGDFCLRTNPDGVDLNRNWDEEWQPGAVLDAVDTNPGSSAFSESESKAFKGLVEDYKPTNFLTIHSGTKGMYMPWAYDMEHLAQRNQPQMMEILKTLDRDHCECPYGAAGREVGYSCPGTCLDWVYDKLQTPYAFAFEIYVGGEGQEADLRERWQRKLAGVPGAFYQTHSHLAHEHFKELFTDHPSSFVQVRSESGKSGSAWDRSPENCFQQFNPKSEDEYKRVVDNWSAAYLDMAAMVAANLKRGGVAAGNSSSSGSSSGGSGGSGAPAGVVGAQV